MSKRPRIIRSQRKIIGSFEIVNPNAAGIDAGSEQHWVCVPEGRSDESIRSFGTFTEDLYALADWLVACGVTTVALEATGVYWIPLFEILEARGLNPKLVDSRSIGRRSRKTDVLDCQWIWQLHTYGLLDGAFRPDEEFLPLRAYSRQKQMLISYASDHIRHMQKALDLMNVKLHLVVSDITGVTGMKIIRSIIKGDRDPQQLAKLRDRGCKNDEETIARALMGNYQEEHLFALTQAVELFDEYQQKLIDCDKRIAASLMSFDKKAERTDLPKSKKKKSKRRKNQPHFDARELLYEKVGVDLTAIDGMDASSILKILPETGIDMAPWGGEKDFTSWLALAPNKPRSGKTKIYKKAPVVHPNRAAQAFRLCAQTLERSKSALGAFFRRIKARWGRAVAIKATARKLAVIFYSMLKNKTEYRDPGHDYYETRYRERLLKALQKKADSFGMKLVPAGEVH